MKFTIALLTGALIACTGCRTSMVVSRPAVHSAFRDSIQAGPSTEQKKQIEANCLFGLPKPEGVTDPTDLVTRDGYVLLHSATDKIPLFVCEHVTAEQVSGSLTRDNKFQADPQLKPGRRSELKDYSGSGFDRGHMAPAGDQTKDKQLKVETFYLSNMSPQVPALNRQIWKELETLVRDWATKKHAVFIITGPMFYDPKEEDAATADRVVTHQVIGPDSVAVPTHCYKIVAAKGSHGEWQEIAFVLENKKYPTPGRGQHYNFEQFIKPVRWIEERTGLNFMPELEPAEAGRLETTASPMWN